MLLKATSPMTTTPVRVALGCHQIEHLLGARPGDRSMRVGIKALGRKPVIATGHATGLVHPLLDDGPRTFGAEEEAVMVDLESVLHGGRVDLGRKPAGANQGIRFPAQLPARRLDLLRRLP